LENFEKLLARASAEKFPGGREAIERPRNSTNKPPSIFYQWQVRDTVRAMGMQPNSPHEPRVKSEDHIISEYPFLGKY